MKLEPKLTLIVLTLIVLCVIVKRVAIGQAVSCLSSGYSSAVILAKERTCNQ